MCYSYVEGLQLELWILTVPLHNSHACAPYVISIVWHSDRHQPASLACPQLLLLPLQLCRLLLQQLLLPPQLFINHARPLEPLTSHNTLSLHSASSLLPQVFKGLLKLCDSGGAMWQAWIFGAVHCCTSRCLLWHITHCSDLAPYN